MKSFVNLTQALSDVTSKGVNSTFNINRLKSEIQAMQFTPDTGGGGPTYGAILTAVITRANALGYTLPSAATLSAIDAFITANSATFSDLDIFYLFALNDPSLQNFASLNYINPSLYQLSYVSSPSYGIRGLQGNGSTSYGDTNFNCAVNGVKYTQNLATRLMYVETAPTIGTHLDGLLTSANRNQLLYQNTSAHRINAGGTLSASVQMATSVGYKAISRSDSSNCSLYNGTTKTDATAASGALISEDQTLLKAGTSFSNAGLGCYGLGTFLAQSRHTTFRSSYLTYQAAIGL